jgi:rare lipoprotein A
MDNKKSVVVRVNDRGPFISGRVVELSKEAARQIGLDSDGSARVMVEVVNEKAAQDNLANKTEEAPKSYQEESPAVAKTEAKAAEKAPEKAPEKIEKKKEEPAKEEKTSKSLAVNEKPSVAKTAAKGADEPKAKAAPSTSNAVKVSAKDYQPFDLYQIELKRPEKKGFGVQIAALSTQDALFKKLAELQGDWFDNILVSVEKAGTNDVMYKVILGTFASEGEANIYKANLKKNKKMDGFVVDLSNWEKDASK